MGSVQIQGGCVWVVGLWRVRVGLLTWDRGAWLGAAGTVQILEEGVWVVYGTRALQWRSGVNGKLR